MRPLCDAIKRRSIIQFDYRGARRTVEPYLHGYNKTGIEVLRAYQIGGASKTGHRFCWKLFHVDKIEQLNLVKITFSLRKDYRVIDRAITRVHCQVD